MTICMPSVTHSELSLAHNRRQWLTMVCSQTLHYVAESRGRIQRLEFFIEGINLAKFIPPIIAVAGNILSICEESFQTDKPECSSQLQNMQWQTHWSHIAAIIIQSVVGTTRQWGNNQHCKRHWLSLNSPWNIQPQQHPAKKINSCPLDVWPMLWEHDKAFNTHKWYRKFHITFPKFRSRVSKNDLYSSWKDFVCVSVSHVSYTAVSLWMRIVNHSNFLNISCHREHSSYYTQNLQPSQYCWQFTSR